MLPLETECKPDVKPDIKTNTKPMFHAHKFMKSKNRNDIILMNLRWDKPMLKVFQKRTNYLGYMGIPGYGKQLNDHYLYPEEALYLLENNAAVIYLNGKILPLSAAFTMLKKFGISFLKYAAYVQLLKAGYILRRASNVEVKIEPELPSIPTTSKAFHQPQEILNKFPGFSNDGKLLVIPDVTCQAPILGFEGFSNLPKGDQITKLSEDLVRKAEIRKGHEPWTRCRPGYWPSFECLKSAESWYIYSRDKERLMKLYQEQKQVVRGNKPSAAKYDYDVYLNDGSYTHTKQLSPKYRLLVADDRHVNKLPSPIELAELSRSSNVELLIASGEPSHLRFYKANGAPMVL